MLSRLWVCLALLLLAACAGPSLAPSQLEALLPADALLLGEQHDAPAHQRIHRDVIEQLAARGILAGVVIEMAEAGHGTGGLARDASEQQVRAALHWSDASWPWPAYAPAVMAAVRAGVPVSGADLSRSQLRDAMANRSFDTQLPGPALKAQQQLVRLGHCGLLPESQITPMTRAQIARDIAMAQTVQSLAEPGRVVLLLAGAAHVDRQLGVPLHLPAQLQVRVVRLQADGGGEDAASGAADATWHTAPAPARDYCATLKAKAPAQPSP